MSPRRKVFLITFREDKPWNPVHALIVEKRFHRKINRVFAAAIHQPAISIHINRVTAAQRFQNGQFGIVSVSPDRHPAKTGGNESVKV